MKIPYILIGAFSIWAVIMIIGFSLIEYMVKYPEREKPWMMKFAVLSAFFPFYAISSWKGFFATLIILTSIAALQLVQWIVF